MKGWILVLIALGVGAYFLSNLISTGTFTELNTPNTASLVLLLCWGAFIATGVFSMQSSLKEGLRNALAWIGIVLVLMTGYTYRYELQDIASTMTAGAVPPSPISKRSLEGREQATLIKSSSGSFEAVGEINGQRIRFLVDTGASSVVLTQEAARSVGFDVDDLAYTTPVSTANGMTTAATVTLDAISVNGIEKRRVAAMVAREGALDSNLLGMSYINKLWGFEIRGDRMILTD